MNVVIKFLVFSFPVVFAVTLFWPFIGADKRGTDEEASLAYPPAVEDHTATTSTVSEQQPTSHKARPTVSSPSGIYKWTDENGTVVFSDKAVHDDAVAYTPAEIGHYGVSGDVKQRIATDQARLASLRTFVSSSAITQQSYSSRTQAGYAFTNTGAGQKHKYVLLSGRISDGPACKQLKVTATARSDTGQSVRGVDEVSFDGFGSKLFEVRVRSSWDGGSRRPQWEMVNVDARCVVR
jgi:hypothetical protein